MATAEGTLVASTSQGCKTLNLGGGVTAGLTRDAMTRGLAINFPSSMQHQFVHGSIMKEAFESGSWVVEPLITASRAFCKP